MTRTVPPVIPHRAGSLGHAVTHPGATAGDMVELPLASISTKSAIARSCRATVVGSTAAYIVSLSAVRPWKRDRREPMRAARMHAA